MRICAAIAVFFACLLPAFGEENLVAKGEKLFLNNRLEEALPVLETAVIQDPSNERVYIYLGTIYEYFEEYEKAVFILQKGVRVSEEFLDLIYYNIANNLFKQNKYSLADEMYTRTIGTNPFYSAAYLNRANTRVKSGEFPGAVEDYTVYLNMAPETPQRDNIERIISLLNSAIEAEFARIQEEDNRKAAEEARQQALLNDVLSSLQKAVDETKNLSAETEGIEEVREESDIVD